MTTDIARGGVLLNYDILTHFCACCETEEKGLAVANTLIDMGYAYKPGASTQFCAIASHGHKRLLHFILNATKLYSSSFILDCVMHNLSRKQLEPFIEHGTQATVSLQRYQRYIHGHENARVASIALIGAGKRTHRKAVMRIISRVVWSERDDEKWMDLK